MFVKRLRVLPIMVVMLFIVSLFIISSVGKASSSVSDATLMQPFAASASSVHNLKITDISSAGGPIKAGSLVTITGTGFAAGARVVFDETAATDAKVVSNTQITATVPANVKSPNIDVTVFVGTEGASFTQSPSSHGSRSVVHGYKDDKHP
jgi:IPT/TIG domain